MLKTDFGKRKRSHEGNPSRDKLKSQDKLRVEKGPQKVREAHNKWKLLTRKRKIVIDAESVHHSEVKRKKLSRKIQKKTTPIKLKNDQNRWQQKHRLVDSRKKRLNNFRRNTMFNAIFTCLCCHRNLFECNVTKFTTALQKLRLSN